MCAETSIIRFPRMTISAPALTTITIDNVNAETAERVAAVTRRSYVDSDPLPGLPTPDGAVEDAGHVMRFLADGGSIRALRIDEAIVAVLRTKLLSDGAWWVARVAVDPAARARGVGRWLMAEVEATARAEGARTVRLDAVIERCLLPYYANLGYRAVAYHLPDDGKLLTEAAMERDLTQPPEPMPVYGPDPGATGRITWYVTPNGLIATTEPVGRGRLAGVDVWRGDPAELPELLRTTPGARPTDDPRVVVFRASRANVPLHRMPRALHSDLWAVARFRPGHEIQEFPPTASRSET
ncbi:GNAT family N-acetyltransferase [Actinocrispum wychmicini]|uniref:Acetyltransferase (GNAT) family protein n=1 Tax=Actinocrispum wychmicini TaxID=1213861 RepID=A0A4R2JLB7_9PSEU|nr:GNAT family N-acetyltransferase [Actinocrispum wychmicini]TCO60853.1 acetyltransferase (GNAT) family protein [Actinocrispum wychmicini]